MLDARPSDRAEVAVERQQVVPAAQDEQLRGLGRVEHGFDDWRVPDLDRDVDPEELRSSGSSSGTSSARLRADHSSRSAPSTTTTSKLGASHQAWNTTRRAFRARPVRTPRAAATAPRPGPARPRSRPDPGGRRAASPRARRPPGPERVRRRTGRSSQRTNAALRSARGAGARPSMRRAYGAPGPRRRHRSRSAQPSRGRRLRRGPSRARVHPRGWCGRC